MSKDSTERRSKRRRRKARSNAEKIAQLTAARYRSKARGTHTHGKPVDMSAEVK